MPFFKKHNPLHLHFYHSFFWLEFKATPLGNMKAMTVPCESDLEGLVASDEGWQTSQRLFPGTSHSDKQSVTTRGADDARDLQQVGHGVLEEHQVHTRTADALVVLLQEEEETLLQLLEAVDLITKDEEKLLKAVLNWSRSWLREVFFNRKFSATASWGEIREVNSAK